MPDKRVTELAAIDAVTDTDLVMVIDDPAGAAVNKKATVTQLLVDAARTDVSNTFTGDQTIDGDLFVTGEVNPVVLAQQKPKIDLFTGVSPGDPVGSRTVMSQSLVSGLALRHDEALSIGRISVGNYDAQLYQPLLFESETFQIHTGESPGDRVERLCVHPTGGVTVGTIHTDPGAGVLLVTADQEISKGTPHLDLRDTSGSPNAKLWRIEASFGSLTFMPRTDAGGYQYDGFAVNRDGTTSFLGVATFSADAKFDNAVGVAGVVQIGSTAHPSVAHPALRAGTPGPRLEAVTGTQSAFVPLACSAIIANGVGSTLLDLTVQGGTVLQNGVTVNGDVLVGGSLMIGTPLAVAQGGTGVTSQDKCSVYNTTVATQLVPFTTLYKVLFANEEFDTNTMHDPVTNTSRITIKRAGVYMVSGGIFWTPQAITSEFLLCAIAKNGVITNGIRSYFPPSASFAARGQAQNVAGILQCAENDYIEIVAYHEEASPPITNTNLTLDQEKCGLQVVWLGP